MCSVILQVESRVANSSTTTTKWTKTYTSFTISISYKIDKVITDPNISTNVSDKKPEGIAAGRRVATGEKARRER